MAQKQFVGGISAVCGAVKLSAQNKSRANTQREAKRSLIAHKEVIVLPINHMVMQNNNQQERYQPAFHSGDPTLKPAMTGESTKERTIDSW